jgi:molybdopterin converting factor small subunit
MVTSGASREENTMSVKMRLTQTYREYTGNREIVEVEGRTIRECLDHLVTLYPVLKALLFDSEYALGVLIIYGGDVITASNLDRPVADNDEIKLVPMIYGG